FCKTEVHFAAEPGRFNIVETDEKPPPNNIRRRRRTSSGTILVTPHLQDANRISLPEIRFGDSPYEKKLLGGTESKNNSHQIAVSVDPFNKSDLNQSEPITPASGSPSGFQDDADKDDNIFTLANATIPSTMGQDTLEMGVHNTDEDVCSDSNSLQPNSLGSISLCNMMPRSILKNNKKPRPFHLGETDEDILMSSVSEKSERSNEDAEVKWGVRLKPVQSRESPAPSTSSWRSTVTLHNPKSDAQRQQNYTPALILKDVRLSSPQSYEEATHLSKPLKSLQPSFQKMPAVGALGAPIVPKTPSTDSVGTGMELKISMGLPLSVAERVRRVEDLQHAALETRGYSTRVNFGAGETTVIESRSSNEQQTQSTPASPKYQPNNRPKPVWLQREERRQEAMQHCDHADGSPMLKLDSSKEPSLQRSVTEAMLPSYNNSGRLREVETLVSTHSGHPKITSISLRYEGEQDNDQLPKVCDRNPDCDRHQATFHSLPSSKKGSLYTTEFKHPTDFEGNLSSTTVSNKSYKSLFSQPNGNSNSSKSLFTQKQKRLSPSFVESPFQPERETSQFKTSEKDYENLNPKSTTRNNCDPLDTDRTMFLLGRKVRHPETNEFFSKGSGKQESGPTAPSDKRLSNNRRSLSPVMNKMGHKVQEKKQFHSSVLTEHRACGSGNSSDAIRSIRNENEDIKKERLNITEEETKKGSCFHSKTLSNENHKPLEGSEERTKISDHYSNREKRHSQMKSTCSISTKRDRSLSPSEIVHPHTGLPGNKLTMSPLYENLRMLAVEPTAKSNSQNVMSDTVETESAILEELTRAADQILQAVNGYTDEESYKASSDEPDDEIVKDGRKRRGNRCGKVRRPSVSLGTITEGASSKKHQETGNSTSELYTHKSTASGRKSHQRLTKTRLLPTSSTSSVESLTREIPQVQTRALLKQKGTSSINNCNKSRVSSSSTSSTAVKPSCRTVRLLQRASSRELLLQTYASSSEDVASGVEGGNNRKPMVPRRTKIHNTSNNKTDHAKTNLKKNTISPDSHPSPSATAQPRKREADINKPRERFPGSTNKAVPLARKVNGDGSGSPSGVKHHTSRTREDERHQRGSNRPTTRRDNTDLRHRAQGGGTTTLEPGGCDKKERAVIYERHVMGTMGGVNRSSASCTVTKKKPGLASSHRKGFRQIKATK
ncbi:hypothetical protein B7P43_G10866, partial [Cryptotermes secundus]